MRIGHHTAGYSVFFIGRIVLFELYLGYVSARVERRAGEHGKAGGPRSIARTEGKRAASIYRPFNALETLWRLSSCAVVV
jgi:hypothetical protein